MIGCKLETAIDSIVFGLIVVIGMLISGFILHSINEEIGTIIIILSPMLYLASTLWAFVYYKSKEESF